VSIPLYMNVHVPFAITQGLRLRGVDVLTAQEDGTAELSDAELLDRATSLARVVFSQDKNFLREAAERQRAGKPFAGIIYAPQLGVTIGQCLKDLELIAHAGEPEEFADLVQYLPLR